MRELFRRNPQAVVLAVVLHLGLLALLAVGVDWLHQPSPAGRDIELVQARLVDLPVPEPPAGPEQAPVSPPKEQVQSRRQVELEREQRLAAEREAKRREEAEKQRLAALKQREEAERQARLEAEKRRQEQLASERARREAERKQAELERQRRLEAERQREAEEERRRKAEAEAKAAAEAKRKAEAAATAAREAELAARMQAEEDLRERDRAVLAIRQKVERNWLRPPGTAERGLRCRVRVRLSSTGLLIAASVVESSGNSAFDRSVISAVEKSEPFPMPESPRLAAEFRDIVFEFDPSR